MPTSANVRALGEFAAARHGTFDLSQAAEHDVMPHDLRRLARDGLIVRVRSGVYRFTSAQVTWKQQLHAATLGVRAAVSHFSAAALHGLDGFCVPPKVPEILCHHGRAVRVPGALVRRSTSLPKSDVLHVEGIPCTTLARTVCDLAPRVSCDDLVRLIDDVQRRGASMTWLMQRAERLNAPGRAGPSEVLNIVRRRLGGYRVPDSYFERLLGRGLRSPLLEGIVRQHVLRDPSGLFVARFDLAVPWVRLGIEGHSRSFHLGEAAERYDEDRDIRSSQQGWEITYLGFAATRSVASVCHDIELVVVRRASDLGLVAPTAGQLGLAMP